MGIDGQLVELFDETHGAKLAKTPRLAKRGCFFGVNRILFAPLSVRPAHMFGFGKKRSSEGGEEHRYYLLPGMGRSNRRRHKLVFLWSILAGVAGSGLIGVIIWLINR